MKTALIALTMVVYEDCAPASIVLEGGVTHVLVGVAPVMDTLSRLGFELVVGSSITMNEFSAKCTGGLD